MSRDIDKKVSEVIFGNQVISIGGDPNKEGLQEARIKPDGDTKDSRNLAHYSTDIKAAWEVLEKLKHLLPEICVVDSDLDWGCSFQHVDQAILRGSWPISSTAPMAICLAALKSKGVEVE